MRLADTGVSRLHAELRLLGDEVVLVDLGSTNGTTLNGRRVRRAACATATASASAAAPCCSGRSADGRGPLMASALVVTLVKYGLLVLLWLFVLAAVRTVRSDLYGARPRRPVRSARRPAPRRPAAARPAQRRAQAGRHRGPARRHVGRAWATSPVTLGRADESTLVLTDDYASSHHARLAPGDGAWVVEDLGSTNGTYLGRHQGDRPDPGAARRADPDRQDRAGAAPVSRARA